MRNWKFDHTNVKFQHEETFSLAFFTETYWVYITLEIGSGCRSLCVSACRRFWLSLLKVSLRKTMKPTLPLKWGQWCVSLVLHQTRIFNWSHHLWLTAGLSGERPVSLILHLFNLPEEDRSSSSVINWRSSSSHVHSLYQLCTCLHSGNWPSSSVSQKHQSEVSSDMSCKHNEWLWADRLPQSFMQFFTFTYQLSRYDNICRNLIELKEIPRHTNGIRDKRSWFLVLSDKHKRSHLCDKVCFWLCWGGSRYFSTFMDSRPRLTSNPNSILPTTNSVWSCRCSWEAECSSFWARVVPATSSRLSSFSWSEPGRDKTNRTDNDSPCLTSNQRWQVTTQLEN